MLRSVKTAISPPDDTFRRVDVAARRLGVSRSEFVARCSLAHAYRRPCSFDVP